MRDLTEYERQASVRAFSTYIGALEAESKKLLKMGHVVMGTQLEQEALHIAEHILPLFHEQMTLTAELVDGRTGELFSADTRPTPAPPAREQEGVTPITRPRRRRRNEIDGPSAPTAGETGELPDAPVVVGDATEQAEEAELATAPAVVGADNGQPSPAAYEWEYPEHSLPLNRATPEE